MKLLEYAATKEQQVALRTQLKKILCFIRVLALLHQKNRTQIEVKGKKIVIASPEDYEIGLKVLRTTILETISRIGKRQQEILDLFETEEVLDKHKVSKKLQVSTRTAAAGLKTLFNNGYLSENQNVKPYSYQVLRKKAKSFAILKDVNEYERFYRKELENFLEHTLPTYMPSGTPKKIEIQGIGYSSEKESLKKIRVPPQLPVGKMSSEQEANVSNETGKKLFTFSKMASENSLKEIKKGVTPDVVLMENELLKKKNMYVCPFCAAFDKQVIFNSQHDLDAHIQRVHGESFRQAE
jgi:hypothetical protein